MPQSQLTILKFGLAGVALVCGTVLVAFGKLDAATMFHDFGTTVQALIVALGLSGAGSAVAAGQDARLKAARLEAATSASSATPGSKPS